MEKEFRWGSKNRPPLMLEIFRVKYSAWELFKKHHYLNGNINKAAICYVGVLQGRPIVFDAWLHFVGYLPEGEKAVRSHRSVVLPDFQGLGISNRVFTLLSKMWAALGYRVFSGTGHPAEIKKRVESLEWKITGQGMTPKSKTKTYMASSSRAYGRNILRSEFIGEPMDRLEAEKLHAG